MNIHTIQKYYAKQRRNRAIIFSLVVHGIVVIGIGIWLLKPLVEVEKDTFAVDFVSPQRMQHPKKVIQEVKTNAGTLVESQTAKSLSASQSSLPPIEIKPNLEHPAAPTVVHLTPLPESILNAIDADSPNIERGSGETEGRMPGPGSGRGESRQGLGDFSKADGTGEDAFGGTGVKDIVGDSGDDVGEGLGSVIDEDDGIVRGHIRLIRLKHDMSDWWQDPTAIPSLIKWLRDHAPTITADMKYEGGALPLTDKRIMDAPLLIMTGHDQAMSGSYKRLADHNSQASGFSEAESAALRKYILDYNGMLFFDYCGNGGNEKSFATLVQTELRRVFPEYPLTTLKDMKHEIFQCYYKLERTPVGGSTFWGTNYKGGNDKWSYIKGISVPGRLGKQRLAVVFCPLDYLCSMETAEIDSRAPLASRRSTDVYRFMTNMFVYQMRQRADSKYK